jgi:hypothetical protein
MQQIGEVLDARDDLHPEYFGAILIGVARKRHDNTHERVEGFMRTKRFRGGRAGDFNVEGWADERAKYAPIVARIHDPKTPWDRFEALRELYADLDPSDFDPYPFGLDWSRIFTPIEFDMWCAIRSAGMDLWPQFPVGRYFIDFADPIKRIGIECDGKRWHDQEKDAKRDAELLREGWFIYRATGSECHRVIHIDWEEARAHKREYGRTPDDVMEWLNATAEGLLAAVGIVIYDQPHSVIESGDAYRTLVNHNSGGVVPA